ncbi:hypothetical protein [Candidatus Nitrosocosmicus hydrocola]|jgi:hypothetical protein|uniref:hypothetical protein n=1 Tax=Candidatus Nitrosocosmicus hydrocola TaxID=1826872 RepID=UPI0011E607F6|nr:hypothetical protein [Candidatus Nitrosocosmicus hydrocola]
MDKISNSQDEAGALRNVESFVLEKLLSQHALEDDTSSVNIKELMDSVDDSVSPLFDQAIEDLIAQSLIHCEDGENFQITHDGINELENRKKESIPL